MAIRVRLTRKFAQILNGIDLSRVTAGETLELPAREAQLLVAEGRADLVETADDRELFPGRRDQTATREDIREEEA